MRTRIISVLGNMAAVAAALAIPAAQAQEHSDESNILIWPNDGDHRLQETRTSATTGAFNLPSGARASLIGMRNGFGLLFFGAQQFNASRFRALAFHDTNAVSSGTWLDPVNLSVASMSSGGALRDDRQARSSFSLQVPEKSHYSRDDYSRRLFVMPTPNWILKITRGHLSNVDQFEAARDIRRTTISATYNSHFDMGVLQTTFAWGRHTNNATPNTMGYLAETLFRFGNSHTVFGRIERVRSGDFLRISEAVQPNTFRLNKLSAGYYYEVPTQDGWKINVGGMVGRYSMSENVTSIYSKDQTAAFMFIRLQLR